MPDQVSRYEQTRQNIIENYDKIMDDVNNYNPFEGRS